MLELFTMSLAWLGQKTIDAVVGQIAERGAERLVDRFDRRHTVIVPDTPTRHRLGDVTSDVDIDVRHLPPARQRVLLAFQLAPHSGERTAGVTVPMVLGETAHLTLPRGDYLITALVLDPPADPRGKPVLRGIGWVRHWAASTKTDRLTIETGAPTTTLLRQLGLLTPEGTGPFVLPVPKAAAPPRLPGTPSPPLSELLARLRASGVPVKPSGQEPPQCRAATGPSGPRCGSRAAVSAANGLCLFHNAARELGEPVHAWPTGKPIT